MDFKNMKISIGIVIVIVAQAFGIIWYVAQLDSTVSNNTIAIESYEEFNSTPLEEEMKELEERMDSLEKMDVLMENEMRTIMSDHSGFNKVLEDMGKSGYGDNREYGNYGSTK